MDRRALGGGLAGGFLSGAGRDVHWLHGGGPLGPGALRVVVLEQGRRETPSQVPLNMAGERAQEHVRTDMVDGVHEDGGRAPLAWGKSFSLLYYIPLVRT